MRNDEALEMLIKRAARFLNTADCRTDEARYLVTALLAFALQERTRRKEKDDGARTAEGEPFV